MKKVLFVSINSSWSHSPLALYYMRAMLEEAERRSEILNYTLKDEPGSVIDTIIARQPEVLCFSVYIWNRLYWEELIPLLMSLDPELILVCGGPEAGNLSENTPEGFPLYAVTGPGETAFQSLVQSDFTIPFGNIYEPNLPLAEIPFPYTLEDKPDLKGKLVYYETGRGCPFSCVYCLSANDTRREKRFDADDPAQVSRLYSELDILVALEPRTIKFVDRSFNTDKKLARLIWSYFIHLNKDCVSHFEIYPDLLTDEDIELLRQAPPDRIRFEIGIQTVNPATMLLSRRSSDWKRSKAMLIRLRRETKLIIHSDLLIGLPGDNFDSILHSLDELIVTEPHELQLGLLKILPETPMRDIARERGYIWEELPPYTVLRSDALSESEIACLESLSRALNLYYNKGEFIEQWHALLSREQGSDVLMRLVGYHSENQIPLHSMPKQQRRDVFLCVNNLQS